jgi:AcrR family transcriptional regulator
MERKGGAVKPKRRYDATGRRLQADRSRERIVAVARERFLRDGIAATTIAAIAGDASVSVDTVYKTSPELADLRDELDAQRLERMTANARNLMRAGRLRRGMTARRAGELLWTYTAPELYELLVLRRGWTADDYAGFIASSLRAALLPDASG